MELQHTPSNEIEARSAIFGSASSSAFTLIELMISIALVLVLILGVNQIFTYTTQAVGAGQAINAATRDSRAAGSQFSSDFAAMVSPGSGSGNSASLIISSTQRFAFLNKADQAADRDGDPTTRDLNNDHIEGNAPGEVIAPYQYNYRNHRLDILSFFARDLFHRQTGNPGTYVDNMSSQEAWIWYGHLWLPNNSGGYAVDNSTPTFPGFGTPATNPNNYFANNYTLGRVATLLTPKDSTAGTITDNAGFNQWFLDVGINPLSPLAYNSQVNSNAAPPTATDVASAYAFNSRVDLASTSIASYSQVLSSYVGANPPQTANWWDQLMDGNVSNAGRFQCNPYVAKPMQAVDAAHASPYFLGGCGQFIVEFAGDHMTQDNNPASPTYSNALSTSPDKQIDYVLIPPTVNRNNTPLSQWRKQIIWYGLPRSSSGQGGVNLANGDVAPLDTWLHALNFSTNPYYNPTNKVGFEKTLPYAPGTADPTMMASGGQYICAWGPNDKKPSLIRITITLDDPTGRLPEGQTYQYVFPVP